MKILNVIPYWGPEFGGPFVNTANLSFHLAQRGHSVSVLTTSMSPQDRGIRYYPWPVNGQPHDISICICRRYENSIFFSPEFIKVFSRIAKNSDAVIIHGMWRFPTSYAAAYCRKYGVPYFVFTHGMLSKWSLSQKKIQKIIYSLFYVNNDLKNARSIFYMRNDEAERLQHFSAQKVLFRNALNEDESHSWMEERAVLERKRGGAQTTLLYLSRIHPKKGLMLIVRALKGVSEVHPDVRLIVAGPVENRNYLKDIRDFIARNNLERHVFLSGSVTGEEKKNLFLSGDIFVLPTEDDCAPLAVLEALASGIPVVTTPGADMPEIDNKMGFIVPRSVEAIQEAILKLMQNQELVRHMGKAGHEYVLSYFTWGKRIEELLAIFEEEIKR